MKLGKETGNVMNWLMSGNATMPEAGKDGTELCWTDRRSFKVLTYDPKKKCGTAAYYKDCYDTQNPLGTEIREPFNFKFSYKKWRREVENGFGEKSWHPWNATFGERCGYYDLSF